MSILVEIAQQADVSVEGVVRVLTREPVSDAIKERVLEVLDDLTPEQTRAVQRFALAALHDVLELPGGDGSEQPPAPGPDQLMLPVPADEPALRPSSASDAALVELSSVLGELAEAVRDLRRETDLERRERVDDLGVLIDLITTGWQGLDSRLGRIERQVSRLESGRREPIATVPARVVPPAPAVGPSRESSVPSAPIQPVEPPPAEPSRRDRLPFVAALTLVGAVVLTLAVLQLAAGGPDLSRLVTSRGTSETTGEIPMSTASSTTGSVTTTAAATTTSRPSAPRPSASATTSGVLGTTAPRTTRPAPPAATTAPEPTASEPTAPGPTTAPAASTTRPTTTAASPVGFRPTRNWAWAPVPKATYYDVTFTRSDDVVYRGTSAEPKLTLPQSVVFLPGSYRWVVRPGFGERSARDLGPPVVDSRFTVS